MRSYASTLGVRCVHYHADKDTPNLEDVDFASDEKDAKQAARLMMKMIQAINQNHLPKLQRATLVRVEYMTCHRGLARPRMLRDEIQEALDKEGAEKTVTRYRELR